MNYTSSMHTLLKEQLLGNFEHSAQHVETKHKMEQVYYNPIVVVFCDIIFKIVSALLPATGWKP